MLGQKSYDEAQLVELARVGGSDNDGDADAQSIVTTLIKTVASLLASLILVSPAITIAKGCEMPPEYP